MPTLHDLVPALALVPLVVVPAACGGSDPEPHATAARSSSSAAATVDAAFLARADAVCGPYAAFTARNLLRLPHFNRYAPDPHLLPKVSAFLQTNPAYQKLEADLEGLGGPESGTDAWATVLDDFTATATDVQQEIASAAQADAAKFTELDDTLQQDMTALFADLQTAGLGGTACAKAEGDPLLQHRPAG